jgi:hypothetical protein
MGYRRTLQGNGRHVGIDADRESVTPAVRRKRPKIPVAPHCPAIESAPGSWMSRVVTHDLGQTGGPALKTSNRRLENFAFFEAGEG